MSTPIPGVTYTRTHFDSAQWRAPGRAALSVGRDALVPGTYIPGVGTTGVIAGTTLTPVEASASGNILLTEAGRTYENMEFWGQVQFRAPGITLRNCAIRGRNPDTLTENTGCIKSFDTTCYHATLIDCTIDMTPWVDERGASKMSGLTFGIHGGNLELYRCEITGVQDGWNFVGHTLMAGASSFADMFTVIEASWIHGMYFENDFPGTSDKRFHSDCFQFNTGKNIDIRYNLIGGHRDMTGYRTWPNGYNSGDDAWNAAFMIKQELDASEASRIDNVRIHGNWIAGGTAGINHYFVASRPNAFATMEVTDNRFLQRGAGWGTSASGPGTYDSGNGWYVIRSSQIAATYSGNVIHETGTPVPITTGSAG